jgi:hypothetical protein
MPLADGERPYPFAPYCGHPPEVTGIWSRCNLVTTSLGARMASAVIFIILPPVA